MDANPYIVLGVNADCDSETLKKQYREQMRRVHPDLNPGDAMASEKTKLLLEAFEILSDPVRRAALDRELEGLKPKRSSHGARNSVGPHPQNADQSRPSRADSGAEPKSRPRKSSNAEFRTFSRSTVSINGQRIESVEGEGIHVTVENTRVHMPGDHSHVSGGAANSQAVHGGGGGHKMGSGTLPGVVMGDLHIEPNASVRITGVVMGNVVSGADVEIKISGQVMGDVVLGARGYLSISGKVMGDVDAAGGQVSVAGMVMGTIRARGGKVAVTGIHLGQVMGSS